MSKELDKYKLKVAQVICFKAHKGQVDKNGEPYHHHPLNVAAKCETSDQKIVALLHDVLEDSKLFDPSDIQFLFGTEIFHAVTAITKFPDETREEYYEKLKKNPLALIVKIRDIEDNQSRLHLIKDDETKIRLTKKYEKAMSILNSEGDLIKCQL